MQTQALDRLADLFLGCLAQSREVAQLLGCDSLAQAVDVLHTELGTDHLEGLGAETGDLRELDESRRVFLPESGQLRHRAGGHELEDLVSRRGTDTLDLGELLLAETGQLALISLDPMQCVLVGANTECLWAALVEGGELGQLGQHAKDFESGGPERV